MWKEKTMSCQVFFFIILFIYFFTLCYCSRGTIVLLCFSSSFCFTGKHQTCTLHTDACPCKNFLFSPISDSALAKFSNANFLNMMLHSSLFAEFTSSCSRRQVHLQLQSEKKSHCILSFMRWQVHNYIFLLFIHIKFVWPHYVILE